ncbi:hypothetical protein [Nocardia sp. NRRL S-836]|uniref:hypothetical protein n=1 Tax=Nocardia sp. NRRL S-836 TaxID=1519492 RepID=UPI0006C28137|nr:hypothetical protein [Nocardia sp. NRRL S-836]KOV85122.1 hypothetical protein ADL03_12625 [Nocardia sp. NRRL S-836]
MFNYSRIATSVLAAAGAALAAASPALADPGSGFGMDAHVPDNPWNHSAVAVCATDVLTAPVSGASLGQVLNHCADGKVVHEMVHHVQG